MYILHRKAKSYLFPSELEEVYSQIQENDFDSSSVEIQTSKVQETFLMSILHSRNSSEILCKDVEKISSMMSAISFEFWDNYEQIIKNEECTINDLECYVAYDACTSTSIISKVEIDWKNYDLKFVSTVRLDSETVKLRLCDNTYTFEQLVEQCSNLNKEKSLTVIAQKVKSYLNKEFTITSSQKDGMNASIILDIVNKYLYTINEPQISAKHLNKILISIGLSKQRRSDGMYYYGIVKNPGIIDITSVFNYKSDLDKKSIVPDPRPHISIEEYMNERDDLVTQSRLSLYVSEHCVGTFADFKSMTDE
jgi:hypothetical protein